MGVPLLVSVEQYLKTSYEPDAEYVDGVIEERTMGEEEHSALQMAIAFYFSQHRREWDIRVRPELRTKTSDRRYRIPDVAILDKNAPRDQIALTPPLMAFEVLSPEDRPYRLVTRLNDFEAMGVPSIYVADPADRSLRRFQAGCFENTSTVWLRGIEIPFSDILRELD